ncbi:asparaginase domain-containing protein [Bacteriovorax sp. DB6_IX]|uniref:asparaginase domain-containing protein n=1 Tax=Bacteriovorax sp. DB6_IX TaxID=1353530 RepID=UPI00038A4CEF|nr:asparaginase domain-containing protein [Bacteriovorax sp. DB6_IX]EQC50427.1 asparaginase domain protein [Bacteriovorax sp. DB6_IX]
MKRIVNRQDIVLVTTGGTIEKSYDEMDGSLSNRESILKQFIIDKLRLPHTNLHVFNIINKDSLYFTDYDRTLLAKTLSLQMEKKIPIVVLHGTDTMSKSAEFIFKTLPHIDVPIIFTGAMKPTGFMDSDGLQNVTESLIAAKLLEPGVYISFHGRVFSVPGVRKNVQTKTFEEC